MSRFRLEFLLWMWIALLLHGPSYAHGMQFSFAYDTLPSGTPWAKELRFADVIEPRDHIRLLDLIKREPSSYYLSTGVFVLNSKGGDVREALEIAEIVQRSYARVFVDKECAGACVFVFLAGAMRFATGGQLGIHRPSYHPSYSKALTATQAQQRYAELDANTRRFLEEARFPQNLIERMFTASSKDVCWLTDSDLQRIGNMPSWFHELALAKCDYEKMDKATTRMGIVEYLKQYNTCLDRISRPERVRFIDEVLGVEKDELWERNKRRLAQ
jgi:hypothetical protein